MAFSYKTPGVYLEEIVKLPPSIASVETAIPCFFGLTQKATETSEGDLKGVAKKISSIAEYELYFGMPYAPVAEVTVKLNLPPEAKLTGDYHNNLYYSVKLYFDNGGGPCYIHSIGLFDEENIDAGTYKNEIAKLDLVDEVTLVLAPDISRISDQAKRYDVYNTALMKVAALKDKFVIADVALVKTANKPDATKSKDAFRNNISNNVDVIKYGAAYFPDLVTTYNYDFANADITMKFEAEVIENTKSLKLLNNVNYKMVKKLSAFYDTIQFFNDDYFKKINTSATQIKIDEINSRRNLLLPYFDNDGKQVLIDHSKFLTDAIKKQSDKAVEDAKTEFDFDDANKEKENLINKLKEKAITDYGDTNIEGVEKDNYDKLSETFLSRIQSFFNSATEAKVKEGFMNLAVILPPSPAVAGVYASVDRNRGVWKAPANVSLNAVKKPVVILSDLDQEDFNVDAENGKSINCIRQFTGRGNLVWGARTLAGNNAEWKYVNVRRFFNMVEESCENASRHFVFEPNDANTWVKVKGMIDNYLTNLWSVGALQGAKPEHAFYTAVGLNQTMTQDDVLNGLLIVEIGLAVVRPAEFIVLRFSHKLAVS